MRSNEQFRTIKEWFISKKLRKVSKINQVSKISNGNIMVKSCQKFPNRGGVQKNQKCPKFKNFPSKGGGVSELGNSSQVIPCD